MALLARSSKCYRDKKGNIWVSTYVKYESTTGNPGDYDEVTQVTMNGKEVGHLTCHRDKKGRSKVLQEHGNVALPHGLKEISCG